MGLLFNTRNTTPADVGSYPQGGPAPKPSVLSTAGTLADILLTGGLFHALNQRAQAQQLMGLQAQDRAQLSGMFRGPQTTTSAPQALPEAAAGGVNMFAGDKFGPAPTQAFGGDSVNTIPGSAPTMEQAAPMLARAAAHGVDTSPFVGLIKGMEPNIQFVNGVGADTRDRANIGKHVGVNLQMSPSGEAFDAQDPGIAGRVFPSVEKGQIVLRDAKGNPTGVINLPGVAQAQAETAGAVAGAQERQKASLDLTDVPGPNGSSRRMTRLDAARLLSGQGAGVPGDFGVSQTPGDRAYSEDQAKAANATYQAVQSAGRQAPTKIAQYQELGRLFDGVNGSRLSNTGLEISRWAKSVGLLVDPKLGNKEAGVALGNQIALQLRDPSNGGGMPGSLSNSDRQFLTNMVPNLAQSDQGRRQLVDIYVAKAARDQDVATLARKWQQRYGRIDAADGNGVTFEDQLQKWSEAHPLFGKH